LNGITFIVSCAVICDKAKHCFQNNTKYVKYFKFFRLWMLCVVRERSGTQQNTAGCQNVTEHRQKLGKYTGSNESEKWPYHSKLY